MILQTVNGILNFPLSSRAWEFRATLWIAVHTDDKAVPLPYIAGPLTNLCCRTPHAHHRRERAKQLYENLRACTGQAQSVIAHSNGATVVCDMLRDYEPPHIDTLHLVCPACESDFNRNGLNRALGPRQLVDRVIVYCGGRDLPLRIADTWLGRLAGFGALGHTGPVNVAPSVRDRVKDVVWPARGHCDCFQPEHFHATMKEITK